MIVLKYQDSTTEKFFENARRYQSFLGVGGKQVSNKIGFGPNIEDSPNLYFMFFDRYEIHIQAFVHVINENKLLFNHHPTKNIFWENPTIF